MKQFTIIFSLLFVFAQNISAQADTSTVFTVAIDDNSAAYNKAGTQLSFTKMNVLYIGVENPIAISIPGASSKDITAQISSGGTIKKQEDGPAFNFEYGFNPLKFLAEYIKWCHPDSVAARQLEKLQAIERLTFRGQHANRQPAASQPAQK